MGLSVLASFPFPFCSGGGGTLISNVGVGTMEYCVVETKSPNAGASVVLKTGASLGRVTGLLAFPWCGGLSGVDRSMGFPPVSSAPELGDGAFLIGVSPSSSVVGPYLLPMTSFGGGGPLICCGIISMTGRDEPELLAGDPASCS